MTDQRVSEIELPDVMYNITKVSGATANIRIGSTFTGFLHDTTIKVGNRVCIGFMNTSDITKIEINGIDILLHTRSHSIYKLTPADLSEIYYREEG